MKTSIKLIITFLILAGYCLIVNNAMASESNIPGTDFTEKITMTIPCKPGMEIILEHSFGNMDIRTGQDGRISIDGLKKITVKNTGIVDEFFKEMKLVVDEKPNRVTIKTEYPDKKYRDKVKNYSISYTIEVPRDIVLDVQNSFGNVDIQGVSEKISIKNGFGNLTANDLRGETVLTNKFGTLVAHNIDGNTLIRNEHSSLDIFHITGNLTAETKFGSIRIEDVAGTADISGGYGKVDCSKIMGNCDIKNSFGEVICTAVDGMTGITNGHGAITVSDIKNSLSVRSSFGRISAGNVRGDVRVDNQHAAVEIELVEGNAEVNNSFGAVNASHVGGNVIVVNQHGSITARGVLQKNTGSKRTVRLKTSHAPITLSVPESLSAKITASTSFGKFKCDMPVLVNFGKVDVSSSNNQNITGTIGDGRDTIELEASFADIRVEKE
ncbi:DUF4097 domain-containing protein [bacterium]|nr:DUF4097 domain-containing protein [bacterium]